MKTRRLKEQVRRNANRFPSDFLFQLTAEETREVVANRDHLRNLKYSSVLPTAFTEHGATMVASVLSSPRAVEMSVFVVRAFIRLRKLTNGRPEIEERLRELERLVQAHDAGLESLVKAIRVLISQEPVPARRRIGFSR